MTESSVPKLDEIERQVKAKTLSNHKRELVTMLNLLNTFIDGFNLIGSVRRTDKNEVEFAWILQVTRCFHSLRCAFTLMQLGYYAQAMMVLRTVTEDCLICKDYEHYPPTLEALLDNKHRFGDRKLKLRYIDMAKRVGAQDIIYEQDYRYQSGFTHSGTRSLGILIDPETNEMRAAPSYDEMLFYSCSEMLLRNALRIGEFMERFLIKHLQSRVKSWQEASQPACKEAARWLTDMQQRYGNTQNGSAEQD